MYCQKCRTPLKVDNSLTDLNPAAFDLLIGSAAKSQHNATSLARLNYPSERKELYDRVTHQASSPLHKRTIPAPQEDDDQSAKYLARHAPTDMSFIEITQSQVVGHEKVPSSANGVQSNGHKNDGQAVQNGDSMHSKVVKNEKLFSILSSYSDIDHPICSECTSLLLQGLSARLATATRERDAYAGFLKTLQQNAAVSGFDDKANAEKELEDLRTQDEQAFAELLDLEAEKAALAGELADLQEESRDLEVEEQAFWASRNAHEKEVHDLTTELQSLQQKYAHDQQQLEKLQRTNVFNDTFCIGHDGLFATINGLRLGRLSSQNVEWAEINAAWGQTLLLLATVAERMGFTFNGYRLKPLGSTSRIEKLEYPQQAPTSNHATAASTDRSKVPQAKVTPLELYSSGETALGRVFNHRKFDTGMVAFLDCLSQVMEHVTNLAAEPDARRGQVSGRNAPTAESKPPVPYDIDGDKIGQKKNDTMVSIKLGVGFQQDESFTKACKYVLTCCKFLLAYCSNRENRR